MGQLMCMIQTLHMNMEEMVFKLLMEHQGHGDIWTGIV